MPYEHKPGQVSLFRNDRKHTANSPDWRGDGMDINGNRIVLEFWERQPKRGGDTYLSGKITSREEYDARMNSIRQRGHAAAEPEPASRPRPPAVAPKTGPTTEDDTPPF